MFILRCRYYEGKQLSLTAVYCLYPKKAIKVVKLLLTDRQKTWHILVYILYIWHILVYILHIWHILVLYPHVYFSSFIPAFSGHNFRSFSSSSLLNLIPTWCLSLRQDVIPGLDWWASAQDFLLGSCRTAYDW